MWKLGVIGAACALSFALGGAAQAASFDCGRAREADEKAICANRALNDKDVQVALLFDITKRLVPMGTRDNLRDTQISWLRGRGVCKSNVACLTRSYDGRLAELNKVMQRVYSAGPF